MTKRTYPHISGRNKLRAVPLCCVCRGVAVWRIDIQVSYMRGEDEVRHTCNDHARSHSAEELLALDPPMSQPSC